MKQRVFIDTGGATCPKAGSKKVAEALRAAVKKAGLETQVEVIERGCFGLCNLAPNLYIEPDGVWYSRFTLRDVPWIIRQHLVKGKPIARLIHYPDRRASSGKPGGTPVTEALVAREVEVGDVAPDFTLKNEEGLEVTLSSFRGKKNVLLAFYPFDWSPVCTTENCALTEDLARFEGKDIAIFGISCDSHFSHKAWREKLGLKHSLLSDLKREVAKKYGLYFADLNCAKRATVLLDRSGKVIFKKVQEIRVPRKNEEILSALR